MRWLPTLGRAVALAALLAVGRASAQPDTNLALFWPAAGVIAAWGLRVKTRVEMLTAGTIVLVVCATANIVTGFSVPAGLVLGLANVGLGVVVRLVAGLVSRSGRGTVDRLAQPADLGRLLLAATTGAVASALLGVVALAMAGRPMSPVSISAWVVRNGVGAFAVAAVILVMRPSGTRRKATPIRWAEVIALTAAGLLLVGLLFAPGQRLPLAFVPFILLTWAGLRLAPQAAAGYGLGLGLAVLVLLRTVNGGPFAAIADPNAQAVVVQVFIGLAVGMALLPSLLVAERTRLETRLRVSEQQARAQAEELQIITDTMADGLLLLDADGATRRSNPAATRILGGERAGSVPGHPLHAALAHLDGRPMATPERPIVRALHGEEVRGALVRYFGVPDEPRILSVDTSPLHQAPDSADPPAAVMTFRDVTREYQHLEELEAFAGTVAHDLQSPIAIIRGWAETLSDELSDQADPTVVVNGLSRIDAGARRAQTLINDLLDYSSGRTASLRATRIELSRLTAELTEDLRHAHAGRSVTVTAVDLPSVLADPTMTRQLMTNLLGNAVKYTAPGVEPHVTVSGIRTGDRVQVVVEDNGIGIPVGHRQRVFDPFHRATDDPTYSGTGLGLAICAGVVQRHGGSIAVTDRGPLPGSRFTFDLPAAPHPAPPSTDSGHRVEGRTPHPGSTTASEQAQRPLDPVP